jgi:hypothetical protein
MKGKSRWEVAEPYAPRDRLRKAKCVRPKTGKDSERTAQVNKRALLGATVCALLIFSARLVFLKLCPIGIVVAARNIPPNYLLGPTVTSRGAVSIKHQFKKEHL